MLPCTVTGEKRRRAPKADASSSRTKPRIEDSDATASESGSTSIEVSPTTLPITSPTGNQGVVPPAAGTFNSSKFIDADASDRYDSIFVSRSVQIEQHMFFADFEKRYPRVIQLFDPQVWTDMLSSTVSISLNLVREFYANMHDFSDGAFKSRLRGKTFTVSPDLIRELIGTPLVNKSPYPCSADRLPTRSDLIRCFVDGKPTTMNEVGVGFGLVDLPVDYRLIYRIVAKSLHLIDSTDPMGYFLYTLLEQNPIDFSSHAIDLIWNFPRTSKDAMLPFGGLIMHIVMSFGIDPVIGGDIKTPPRPFKKNFIWTTEDRLLKKAVPLPDEPEQPAKPVHPSNGAPTSKPTLTTQDLPTLVAQLVQEVSQLREVVAKQETTITLLQETLDDHITAFAEERGMLANDRQIQGHTLAVVDEIREQKK